MIKVFVEEEYGYRYWIWEYPGTKEELIADWKAHKAPLCYFDPRNSKFEGELKSADIDHRDVKIADIENGCDAYAHVHWDEDTVLKFPAGGPLRKTNEHYPAYPEKFDLLGESDDTEDNN